MAAKKPKVPATPEERLQRKVERLQGRILVLEASAQHAAEERNAEADTLREELAEHRQFIIGQLREPFPAVMYEFIHDPRHVELVKEYPTSRVGHEGAERDLVNLVVEAAGPRAFRDALQALRGRCPLCNGEPLGAVSVGGYAVPTGLERHLTGWGNAQKCFVMKAVMAEALREARWAARYPSMPLREGGREREGEKQAPDDPSAHVRPCTAERELPEDQVTTWEVDSDGEVEKVPYGTALTIPSLKKWVRGTKVQAAYVRERWMTALRWCALPRGTRFYVLLGFQTDAGLAAATLLNSPDEALPSPPTLDRRTRSWVGQEPVVVDTTGGFEVYEWEYRKRERARELRRG